MTFEQWSLGIIPGLWTFGLGLIIAVLSGFIIERNSKNRYLCSNLLLKYLEKLGYVSLITHKEQKPMEKTQEYVKRQETCVSPYVTHNRREPPQFSTHLHNAPSIMSLDSMVDSELTLLTPDLDLVPDNVGPNRNANFSSNDTQPSVDSQVSYDQDFFGKPDRRLKFCSEKSATPTYAYDGNKDFHGHGNAYVCSLSRTGTAMDSELHQTVRADQVISSVPYAGTNPYINREVFIDL
ncbi:hypothetical protein EGW08_004450, partial [Elysia chlorotica]